MRATERTEAAVRELKWRERFPDEVTCVRCLEVRPVDDVDRLLWCEACRERAQVRASQWGWTAGAVAALALALWIWIEIEPSAELVLGGWIATVVAALWIGSRIAREIAYGMQRFRNRRAVEAAPPSDRPDEEPPVDEHPDAAGV